MLQYIYISKTPRPSSASVQITYNTELHFSRTDIILHLQHSGKSGSLARPFPHGACTAQHGALLGSPTPLTWTDQQPYNSNVVNNEKICHWFV